MERVCTRCGKNFDTDSLPEGYSKHKLLSRCKECVYDIDKRKRIKNYLLKKDYSTLTTKEKSFISNYRDINVPILVTDNPKIKENLSKQKVKEEKLQCSLCLRYLSPSRFYYHSNGSFFKKCKTCLKKSRRSKERKTGHIYIITNKVWEGYYKIGKTTGMKRRLGSYQTSSPFRDYEVLYISKSFEYSTLVEIKIEDLFGKYKVKGNEEYEWYKLSKNQLTEVIEILDETNEGYSGEKYFE